jgi:hypothetical protein
MPPGMIWIGDVDYTGPCDTAQDRDSDHIYDIHDDCPTVYNPNQIDTEDTGRGDACPPRAPPRPVVTGVEPRFGGVAGQRGVTVTGQGFATGLQGIGQTSFQFGSGTATNVHCSSDSVCVKATPAHGLGSVDVTAMVGGVQSHGAMEDIFTYTAPKITRIAPRIGPDIGNLWVQLFGTGFLSGDGENDSPFR